MNSRALLSGLVMVVPLGAWQAPAPSPGQVNLDDVASRLARLQAAFEGQGYLGVGVADIDSNRARELQLKEEYGVEVTRVEEDSAAAKAGLKTGDVILEYNGERVQGIQHLIRLIHETPPGRQIKLLISRNGAQQTVTVAMGSDRARQVRPVFPDIVLPDIPRFFTTWNNAMLGVEAEALNPQLAAYFGVKEGVLVRSVAKGSAAEKAGIKAGDVITKIDQTTVTSPNEISNALRTARSKKTFPVALMRDRHETSVTVSIEDGSFQQGFPSQGFPRPVQPAAPARPIKL